MTERSMISRSGRKGVERAATLAVSGSLAYSLGIMAAMSAWLLTTVGTPWSGSEARSEWLEGLEVALALGALAGVLVVGAVFVGRRRLAAVAGSRLGAALFVAGGLNFALLGALFRVLDFWTMWRFVGPIVVAPPMVCVFLVFSPWSVDRVAKNEAR